MKYLIYIVISIFIIISCESHDDTPIVQTKVVNNLCDFITGEDAGGDWSIVLPLPSGSTLTDSDLSSPCPNIDFNDFGCGLYSLKYLVESTTCEGCKDSTIVNIELPCCTGLNVQITGICQ